MEKPWYASKTIWMNAFAFFASIMQAKYGWIASPEQEAMFFAIANIIFRSITHKSIT